MIFKFAVGATNLFSLFNPMEELECIANIIIVSKRTVI